MSELKKRAKSAHLNCTYAGACPACALLVTHGSCTQVNPKSSGLLAKAVKAMTNIYIKPQQRACCPCAPILASMRHQALLHGLF